MVAANADQRGSASDRRDRGGRPRGVPRRPSHNRSVVQHGRPQGSPLRASCETCSTVEMAASQERQRGSASDRRDRGGRPCGVPCRSNRGHPETQTGDHKGRPYELCSTVEMETAQERQRGSASDRRDRGGRPCGVPCRSNRGHPETQTGDHKGRPYELCSTVEMETAQERQRGSASDRRDRGGRPCGVPCRSNRGHPETQTGDHKGRPYELCSTVEMETAQERQRGFASDRRDRRGRACPVPLPRHRRCVARATTRVAPTNFVQLLRWDVLKNASEASPQTDEGGGGR